jgi:hypothetical protein
MYLLLRLIFMAFPCLLVATRVAAHRTRGPSRDFLALFPEISLAPTVGIGPTTFCSGGRRSIH